MFRCFPLTVAARAAGRCLPATAKAEPHRLLGAGQREGRRPAPDLVFRHGRDEAVDWAAIRRLRPHLRRRRALLPAEGDGREVQEGLSRALSPRAPGSRTAVPPRRPECAQSCQRFQDGHLYDTIK